MKENHSRKKLFGTNGIRAIPNEDMSMQFCLDIGKASASVFSGSTIAVGRDTRISGPAILSAVVSGLLSSGKNVVDLGVLPTPALQYYCKRNSVYGIVITASHNPPEFNGIKCIDSDGTELSKEKENRIEDAYYNEEYRKITWSSMGSLLSYSMAIDDYVTGIGSRVEIASIGKKGFRIAFDAGNGASYYSTPLLLEKLGCKAVTLNCNPDGMFSSRNSEPKEENLTALKKIMKNGNFDLGIAHDGDADRAVFFDENGNFIDGDTSLSLLVMSVIEKGDTVVTPVSSSDTLVEICKQVGATLVRTRVGAPIVSREMIARKARIGGEENGGVIYSDHQFCRDGAMTAALFINLMAKTGKKASELIASLPEYHLYRTSVKLQDSWNKLEQKFLQKIEVKDIDRTDGFRIIYEDSWVLIRPSGTEPIVRIYGHSRNRETAKARAEEYNRIIMELQ